MNVFESQYSYLCIVYITHIYAQVSLKHATHCRHSVGTTTK
jgi:hypothetical protein